MRLRIPANLIYLGLYASGLYGFLLWAPLTRAADLIVRPLRSALPLSRFAALPFEVRWVIVFLAVDFTAYLAHRMAHANRLLWRFHRVHHSDGSLGVLTTFRCHVVEVAWRMFARALPLRLFDIDPASMPIGLFVIPLTVEILAHADLDWSFGFVGKLLVTPAYHRVHHGAGADESLKNFAMLLPLWDFVFRTSAAVRPERYGLANDEALPESFVGQLIFPFVAIPLFAASPRSAAARTGRS